MTLFFTADKNYLKRSPVSGSTTMNAPNVATAWSTFETSTVITHNLNSIPLVRVFYEPYADGNVFFRSGQRGLGGAETYTNGIACFYQLSTTTLTIFLGSDVSKVGTIPIYWVIYLENAI